jgi:uncharacterized protein YfaS (alpha-2-macroglobulin family)
MKKFRLSHLSTIIVLAVLFFLPVSCKKDKNPFAVDPGFSAYVISFTSGVVSNTTKIQVRLIQEVENAVPGKEPDSNPFSFSPRLSGKAVWLDKQTIEFIPDERPESGEMYEADFAVGKFLDVPSEFKTLTFRFQIMKQHISFDYKGISPVDETDMKWQNVHGSFVTADFADSKSVENLVSFGSVNNSTIRWKHDKDGRKHHFTIEKVERKKKSYDIKIRWDGEKIGAKEDESSVEMPALGTFKLIHLKNTAAPKPLIEVYFSDPLSKRQDMDGLFSLSDGTPLQVLVSGNVVKLIPTQTITGDVMLYIQQGIRNFNEQNLITSYSRLLRFVSLKPQVELVGDGVIIPNGDGILFPFRAVSLKAVDVKIIKIFENNIVQFLQANQLDQNNELKRVGRVVYSQEVQLTSDEEIDYTQWNNFSLDLSKLISPEPGAIYRIELSFRKKHALYPCANGNEEEDAYAEEKDPNENYNEPPGDLWGYYDDDSYWDYENYNWEERDDPCKPTYYMESSRRVARNVLASDFGLIVKAGTDNNFFVAVSSLTTTEPYNNVELEFRNLQNQVVGVTETNSDGFASIKLMEKPFVLIAKKDKQRGYLRLDDASSLSLSMFDVGGEELKKGVKGYIYGERGVWRPGDIIYLTFILEDKNKSLPANHPVVLEFRNPSGMLLYKTVKTSHLDGFYHFAFKTNATAPTGNWNVKVRVGGSEFSRNLRIETVKPNRLKINVEMGAKIIKKDEKIGGKVQVNWLHGAPAANAKVNIEATMAATKTSFETAKDYIFDDPTKKVAALDVPVFSGTLNAEGNTNFESRLDIAADAPGMLALQLKTTAFEGGGDFSSDRFILQYSPYTSYVGVKVPVGKGWNNALNSDERNLFPVAMVDANGKAASGSVKVEIYSIYWRWWWEQSPEEFLANYVSNENAKLIRTDFVQVNNGRAMYEMNLGTQDWGRKFIRLTNTESGHSTGAVFYTTYKGWWSNAGNDNPGGAEMLQFQTNKKSYKTGEKIELDLPVTHKGKALISIETGSKVLQYYWFEPKGNKRFKFEATPEMAPNIYIHVTYIQPHAGAQNDFPIRMYGVQSVKIEDPETHLKPRITMANELKPLQKFTVKVDETNGKPMTYTIAVVDEGLLDLTRFETPNPWNSFYTHEALGVRTWDLYKYVAGAFTGKLAGLYAIGGDQYFDRKGKANNNRFKPVVMYQGPFSIPSGGSKTHTFTMPNYVGSVRVMVVAGKAGAYGNAEKAVPVRQALMVLPTLPRVISPTESIRIPVAVFSMDTKVKTVQVQIQADKKFIIEGGNTRTVTFDRTGEKMTYFNLRTGNTIGSGKIIIKAIAGKEISTSETEMNIRLPNPPAAKVIAASIAPGKTWSQTVDAFGIPGTNSGQVEIYRLFPVNIEKRLQYLIQYPHGCIEQITSAAFPQLYLPALTDLDETRKATIEYNIKSCLTRLKNYQLANGGFSYWENETQQVNEWGTSYAGHFMLEAQAMGYKIPDEMLAAWLTYQTREANNWKPGRKNYNTDLMQAYRLYTLALAKKPVLSAMNLMRETAETDPAARWRLAAAYGISGKTDIGAQIINNLQKKPEVREDYFDTYGSYGRDLGLMLETMIILNKQQQALAMAQDVANQLASDEWMSTQTTACMLLAISKFAGAGAKADNIKCLLKIDGKNLPVNTSKLMLQNALSFRTGNRSNITINNTGSQPVYVRIVTQGVPLMKGQESLEQNLALAVQYTDKKGNKINPVMMKPGIQFYATISIKHPGIRMDYKDMALSMLIPSGWEIINSRMEAVNTLNSKTDVPDYQDIRDDRVYMYFSLPKGSTKTFSVLLQSAYPGKFYLPSVQVEAMYDGSVRAYSGGYWVQVN